MKEYLKLFALFILTFIFYSCGEQGKVVDINEDKYYLNEDDFWEPTNGPYNTEIVDMYLDKKDNLYITCNDLLKKNAFIMRSSNDGKTWENLTENFADSLTIVSIGAKCNMTVFNNISEKFFLSTDEGKTWKKIADTIPGTKPITYIKTDSKGNSYVLALKESACYNSIFRSTDYGATWITISDSVSIEHVKPKILFDQNNVTYIFFMHSNEEWFLFRSTDHGETWSIKSGYDSYQVFDIGFDYNLFKRYNAISTDMGESWIDFGTKGKYNEFCIKIFESKNHNIYLNSSGSIYKSTDMGETWELIFKSRNIKQVVVDSRGYLYSLMYNSMINRSKKPVE